MSFITDFIGGTIFSGVKGILDKFITDPDKKLQVELEMAKIQAESSKLLEQSFQAEMDAKKSVMVAELQYGDTYTKRMRPTIGYFGMAAIFFNYCLIPLWKYAKGIPPEPFAFPSEFWYAWTTVIGIYSLGRSYEKSHNGIDSKALKLITGSK